MARWHKKIGTAYAMPTLLYSFVLISYECEALESNDLQILVLLSEPL